MRLAVLADVHSNLPALQAVLADVDRIGPDGIWVAGDLVGYNPWPNEVLEILRERHVRAIRGNHDRGAIGGDTFRFNELAAEAVRWTRIPLTPAGVGYLKDLEHRTRGSMSEGLVAMYHGSPRNDDEYVFPWAADESIVRAAHGDDFDVRSGIFIDLPAPGRIEVDGYATCPHRNRAGRRRRDRRRRGVRLPVRRQSRRRGPGRFRRVGGCLGDLYPGLG